MGSQWSAPERVSQDDRKIFEIKLQRDKLVLHTKKLEKHTDELRTRAKDAVRNENQPLAMVYLRRRKINNDLLDKAHEQLLNIESLISTIEHAVISSNVMAVMRKGNHVLDSLHKRLSLAEAERIVEKSAEQKQIQKELGQILSGQMLEEEQDDIMAQLQMILEEQNKSVTENSSKVSQEQMPSVPSKEPQNLSQTVHEVCDKNISEEIDRIALLE